MECVACGGAAISERPERAPRRATRGSVAAFVASSLTNELVGP